MGLYERGLCNYDTEPIDAVKAEGNPEPVPVCFSLPCNQRIGKKVSENNAMAGVVLHNVSKREMFCPHCGHAIKWCRHEDERFYNEKSRRKMAEGQARGRKILTEGCG